MPSLAYCDCCGPGSSTLGSVLTAVRARVGSGGAGQSLRLEPGSPHHQIQAWEAWTGLHFPASVGKVRCHFMTARLASHLFRHPEVKPLATANTDKGTTFP